MENGNRVVTVRSFAIVIAEWIRRRFEQFSVWTSPLPFLPPCGSRGRSNSNKATNKRILSKEKIRGNRCPGKIFFEKIIILSEKWTSQLYLSLLTPIFTSLKAFYNLTFLFVGHLQFEIIRICRFHSSTFFCFFLFVNPQTNWIYLRSFDFFFQLLLKYWRQKKKHILDLTRGLESSEILINSF